MKVILWLAVVIAAAAYISGPVNDPDLWWHITIGRWIVSHHSLPHTDLWTMFGSGLPWRAYSWVPEIVFSVVDGSLGDRGLAILQFIIGMSVAASFMYVFAKISRDWFVGGLLGVFAFLGSYNNFTLRPQCLIWIYLVWLLLVADRIEEEGISRTRNIQILLIMTLWANTHFTAVLGLLGISLWLWKGTRESLRTTITVLAFGFVGTLITPYLGGEWITLSQTGGHPFLFNAVAEFKPATILQYPTGFIVLGLTLLSALLFARRDAMEPGKLTLAALYVLGGLSVVKFIPISLIGISAAAASLWRRGKFIDLKGGVPGGINRLRELFTRIPREGLSFVLVCWAIVNIYRVWNYPLNLEAVPVKALDLFLDKNLPHPILNGFGEGGYVMYRLSDERGELSRKVSIDGRTNLISHELWEKFIGAYFGSEKWRDYIDAVHPQTIIWKNESPLNTILLAGGEWCRIFRNGSEDRGFSVYVKREYFLSRGNEIKSDNCVPHNSGSS